MVTKFRSIKARASWSHGGHSDQVYAEDFPSQSHFYAGKLLRSAPLWAISGSSSHLISMLFLFLGSRDLIEQD
jgi:hypothetical protein